MNFSELTTTKKGNIGEDIIIEKLEEAGLVIYIPRTEKPHPYDLIAWRDKNTQTIIDVKTKARRNYFPDTGLDTLDLHKYLEVKEKHNHDVYIFFVDEMEERIYYQEVSVLMEIRTIEHKGKKIVYPKTSDNGEITYFHLKAMRHLCQLTPNQVEMLKNKTNRNYEYATC